jgi:hypothetical protein
MKKLVFTFLLITISFTSFGKSLGGATSGGGDLIGINTSKTSDTVFEYINKIGHKLYSAEELDELEAIRLELKIIMVDNTLDVSVDNLVQSGDAFSIRKDGTSTIFLIKAKWNNIQTLLERELLIHHELMVLAGIEETGDYHVTNKFGEIRNTFWQTKLYKKNICTINVFEKEEYGNDIVPGKLIGSSSSFIPFMGTMGDMGILKDLGNGKALIWNGVIGSTGYFRMYIAEAEFYKVGFFEKKGNSSRDINLGKQKIIEAERVYFDPYDIEKPAADPIFLGEKYAVVVDCKLF